MDDFLVRALVAGMGVAAVAGPLGAFVVWRHMAYFGATLSHSALLGVASGFLLGIDPVAGVVAVCVAVALTLVVMQRSPRLGSDTLLGVLAHAALALGLVVIGSLETVRLDLMSYLFGDILAVSTEDIALVYGGGLAVAAALVLLWRPLLAITVHEELASVEGVPVALVRLAFMLLLAVVVALAMKVVGILLVTALLIIPPAAARGLATSPEGLAGLAAAAGCAAVGAGLWGSLAFDTPGGPSIVVAALGLFLLSQLVAALSRRR